MFIYVHYVIKVWCTEKCKLERTDLTKSQTSAEKKKDMAKCFIVVVKVLNKI